MLGLVESYFNFETESGCTLSLTLVKMLEKLRSLTVEEAENLATLVRVLCRV